MARGARRSLISKYWNQKPDDAMKELGGERWGEPSKQIWSVVQYADLYASEPSDPAPRTCFCGGVIFLIVMIPYAVLAFTKVLDSEPHIQITNKNAKAGSEAPMPSVALSLGESGSAEGLNMSTFLKYVSPTFTYRTIDIKHRLGRVKTRIDLQLKYDQYCNFDGIINQSSVFLCVLKDEEPYEAKVKIEAQDEETKQRMGNQSQIEETQLVENLKLTGRYNQDYFAWLEVLLKLRTSDNLWDGFMTDSKGRERGHKLNVWFKFDQEAWKTDEGLQAGDWISYVYNSLPPYVMDFNGKPLLQGAQNYHAELTVNQATLGQRRALSTWTQTERNKEWFNWDMKEKKDIRPGAWEEGDDLFEANIKVGRHLRELEVAYPTFADMFTAIGADYNVAFFAGVVWTTLLSWLLSFITSSWVTPKDSTASDEAKESLQNYCTIEQQNLQDKLKGEDKMKIEKAIHDTLDWLDQNQLAEKEEFKTKQKELEGIINRILNTKELDVKAAHEKDNKEVDESKKDAAKK